MKHKTSELTGALLDAAVAMANDSHFSEEDLMLHAKRGFRPSTDWADGGPIIEREGIGLLQHGQPGDQDRWIAGFEIRWYDQELTWEGAGPTALIAAMRAYVASKLGDEVELP